MIQFLRQHLELLAWTTALIALAFSDPTETHFSLCPLAQLGFDFCPGCGLGHSISWLFRLQFRESWQAHFMGAPAMMILFHRIYVLIKPHKNPGYESKITHIDPRYRG